MLGVLFFDLFLQPLALPFRPPRGARNAPLEDVLEPSSPWPDRLTGRPRAHGSVAERAARA